MDKKSNFEFKWVLFGMCVAAWLFTLIAAYLIVRIVDNNWADWRLPAILGISFLLPVVIGGMFCATGEIKKEIEKELGKKE